MDFEVDKLKHFGAGLALAVLAGINALITGGNWINVASSALLCGVIANIIKEYVDTLHNVQWDWKDVGAGVIGSAMGAIIMALTAVSL